MHVDNASQQQLCQFLMHHALLCEESFTLVIGNGENFRTAHCSHGLLLRFDIMLPVCWIVKHTFDVDKSIGKI